MDGPGIISENVTEADKAEMERRKRGSSVGNQATIESNNDEPYSVIDDDTAGLPVPSTLDPEIWYSFYVANGRKWPEALITHFKERANAIKEPRRNSIGHFIRTNWTF